MSIELYLLNHLDAGEFILLLIIIILAIALLISFFSNKYLSSFISKENNTFVGFFLTSISTNYGFVLGFIIVTLWQELYEVKTFIMQEAEYLSLLMYNMSSFPSSVQGDLVEGIGHYIKVLLQDEWPAMKFGKASEQGFKALSNLFYIIQSYTPETKGEVAFYTQFVNNLNNIVEYRTKRLEFLNSSLIDVIRFMLGFGVLIILFLASLLKCGTPMLKTIAIVLISSVLSFNLGLALLLDFPLAGSISAKPTPFTKGILERFKPE